MLKRLRSADKLSLVLYATGLLFLGMTVYSWIERNSVPDSQKPVLAVNDSLDFDRLTSSANFSQFGEPEDEGKADVLALFVLKGGSCATGLNEVVGYRQLLEAGGLEGRPVQTRVVIVDKDVSRAARFVKTAGLQGAVIYGYEPTVADKLLRYGHDTVPRQLAFLDRRSGTVFFRAQLAPGQMSPVEARREVISLASNAYEATRE